MNLKTLKLKTSIHTKHFAEMTMIAEDVPLPDDEGLEDEVVSENIEGSSEEKSERSTTTHRFLSLKDDSRYSICHRE
jgi:hypothetical protein